ncbi:MAG: thioredoxin [Eubacteriales bacterium]|nr:thioredoxin [Eubacteriales bacterium]
MAAKFTMDNFQKEVTENKGLVIVDFFATWCGPCKMLTPIIDALAEEYKDKVLIGKVDIDENPELAQANNVMSVPTVLFVKGGEVKETLVGVQNKAKLVELIEKYQ